MASEAELDLAYTICEALPGADRLIFCNSGTESFIMALRICRALTGRLRVAKFEGHFHGFSDQGLVSSYFRQDGSLERPTAIEGTTGCDPAAVRSTIVLQYGHTAALDIIREQRQELACVIIEPLMAALVRCDVDFLRQLRALCTELSIPLIFDEVVTAFRVDYGGVQTRYDVHPDLTCLGKIIGGGLPLGAVAGRADFIDVARTSKDPFTDIEKRTFVGGTMSGNSVATRTGLSCLNHLRANRWIYPELERRTDRLAAGLRDTCAELGVALKVRALHSIFSTSFGHQSRQYFRDHRSGTNFKANLALSYYMRKHGVYVPEMHTMLLNAAHDESDIDQVVSAFRLAALEMIDDGVLPRDR
jgi:glutamate-1-semialdehyde 2,1-aminomutase